MHRKIDRSRNDRETGRYLSVENRPWCI